MSESPASEGYKLDEPEEKDEDLNKLFQSQIQQILHQKEHLEKQIRGLENDIQRYYKGRPVRFLAEDYPRVLLYLQIETGQTYCPCKCLINGVIRCWPCPCPST